MKKKNPVNRLTQISPEKNQNFGMKSSEVNKAVYFISAQDRLNFIKHGEYLTL